MTEKIDKSPESTWGASDEYKADWADQHGEKTRKAVERDNEKIEEQT